MGKNGIVAPLFMTLFGGALTLKGVDDWLRAGTSLFGFLTAVVGFAAAVCGLIWWIRKLRKK